MLEMRSSQRSYYMASGVEEGVQKHKKVKKGCNARLSVLVSAILLWHFLVQWFSYCFDWGASPLLGRFTYRQDVRHSPFGRLLPADFRISRLRFAFSRLV